MPRPITKLSDDQQKLLAAAVRAAKKSRESQASADADKDAAWEAIITAREGGVPDDRLCDETGFNRSTLNRRFGARPKGAQD